MFLQMKQKMDAYSGSLRHAMSVYFYSYVRHIS